MTRGRQLGHFSSFPVSPDLKQAGLRKTGMPTPKTGWAECNWSVQWLEF